MGDQLLVRNGSVLLPDGRVQVADVLLQGGKIVGAHGGAPLLQVRRIDAAGAYVLPGLIDLHMHGMCTESARDGSLRELARLEAGRGATTFFPTLFGSPQVLMAAMRRLRQETDDLRAAPQVGGFRLESPYLACTGALSKDDLAPIAPHTTQALLEAGGGHIKMWDISPELPGAPEAIRGLCAHGIVCSIAHTQCTIEQARAAVDAGARLVTHIYDTFVPPHMTDPGVYPAGLTDYLLIEDRVVCEIIGDGTHVHPVLVEVTLRSKTPQRVVFVTDSNYGAGLPPGRYTTPDGTDIVIRDANNGVRMAARGRVLFGSALSPIDNLRNVIRIFGKDLATASQVCSATPARLMGLNKGHIAPGKDADLIILDRELNLLCTIAGGELAYQKWEEP